MKTSSFFSVSLLAIITIILLSGCASPHAVAPTFDANRIHRVAVLVEDRTPNRRATPGALRAIEDEFIRHLISRGYTLVSRSDIEAILSEAAFQRESVLTETQAAQIGRMLNVPAVVIASLNAVDITSEMRTFTVSTYGPTGQSSPRQERQRVFTGHATVGGRMLDVETGQVLWVSSQSGRNDLAGERQVDPVIANVAGSVARTAPDRNKLLAPRRK